MSFLIHERDQDDNDIERYTKRVKVDKDDDMSEPYDSENRSSSTPTKDHILPPSHALLGIPLPAVKEGQPLNFREPDVGISEYIGSGGAKIEGIIKQRFTDFLVFEVDLDGKAIHLKSLGSPDSSNKDDVDTSSSIRVEQDVAMGTVRSGVELVANTETELKGGLTEPSELALPPQPTPDEPWPEHFSASLAPFLNEAQISQVKKMYLEGRDLPRVSDSGWAGRNAKLVNKERSTESAELANTVEDNRNERGGRARGSFQGSKIDGRKVISEPISSKEIRTAFHKMIRELFGGKLETETDATTASEEGCRIIVKWSHPGSGRRGGRGNDAGGRAPRGTYPPYIHFTMQKTNRDTQDALGHLSRLLHVSVKDLSVAGTKDKRGVTVQRVSLLRHKKTVEDVWRFANNIGSRKTIQDALSQRGERGIRVADFNYRKASLELGMLKGNAFVITLRNVKIPSIEILDETMNTLESKGFINYYGMQRFGTASVPTHSIGLALLKSEWQKAADLILQKRHGEHPDVEAARDAWLKERDLEKALSLFPRRVVAERCILENFKKQKGDTRNVMGAISTIPKNLRLMYIHAYQSYVWNAIVSERIRIHGSDRPVVGDLIFEKEDEDAKNFDAEETLTMVEDTNGPAETSSRKSRKPYVVPRVRTLTEVDLDKYTIFDVIMPLPGTDVAYPEGSLGEKYRQFLCVDGLDPDNWVRKQREYTLSGSYRKILHLPKNMSWSVLQYTDPEIPLAQADEDKLLRFDPPVTAEDGKFMAIQISITLGTAAYATMALREITKMDTSSHVQSSLTQKAEDQIYRGGEGFNTGIGADVVN